MEFKFVSWTRFLTWWPLLGLPSWYSFVKSLQLVWKSGTLKSKVRVPDLQHCSDLTIWEGANFVTSVMTTRIICLIKIEGLAQVCSNSSALAMELLQSCAEPSNTSQTVCIENWPQIFFYYWLKWSITYLFFNISADDILIWWKPNVSVG